MLKEEMPGGVFRGSASAGANLPQKQGFGVVPAADLSDADYLYEQGRELSHSGRFEVALDLLERALIIRPHFPVAWYQKGVCLDCIDRQDEALRSYDTCLSHDPHHADAWFNRGMLLKKLGHHEEGDRSVQRAVDLCCGR